jgi:hypothetical protein
MYATQTIPQIDAEIAEKGHFWMESNQIRGQVNDRKNQGEDACRGNGRR